MTHVSASVHNMLCGNGQVVMSPAQVTVKGGGMECLLLQN